MFCLICGYIEISQKRGRENLLVNSSDFLLSHHDLERWNGYPDFMNERKMSGSHTIATIIWRYAEGVHP